ncbi:GNAT family N-acetyltransferase [Aggregatilinea lenta]|uniref:GNAT family N-acetyltransferase n=1 Tax=Aggregatilinea lenta TaxID=913108 RepID=UPI0013C370F4|nr:GNAT family N-acetyltransferase [Aggregatilinea lenta]
MSRDNRMEIVVRGAEAEDWEDAAMIFEHRAVIRNLLQIPYMSRDTVRDRYENPLPDRHALVAVVHDRVVGILGLHFNTGRQSHVASLGLMVHSDYQGRGVGTALMAAAIDLAENWLGCTRMELDVFTDNDVAIRLYQKFGFETEGTLRQFAMRDGVLDDVYLMARVRTDAGS